jgi:hydroxyacylglutathione hydrolase
MSEEITIINLGGVNCYLLKTAGGHILIDTGYANKRAALEKKLSEAGCRPGNLELIVLTHGDSDHADNAAFLREKYGAKIAIHPDDAPMVERGDISLNRKARPDKMSLIFKIISKIFPLFIKATKFEVFKPDLVIDENFDLSAYGSEARIVHLPGHSKGSIGVLTSGGDLFCGDLLYNMRGFDCIYDLNDFNQTMSNLKKLNVKTVYPGHGKPFSWNKVNPLS